jgi:hypothetical protein
VTQTETKPRELLEVYLRDHRAGAAAGLALARRAQEQHLDPDLDEVLSWLVAEIEDEQTKLDELMKGLAISPSPLKQAMGVAAERIGRLKLNDRIAGRSPLSDVVELEGLASAVVAKRSLWRSLLSLTASGQTDLQWLEDLIRRASEQLARIERAHDAAAAKIFSADAKPVEG